MSRLPCLWFLLRSFLLSHLLQFWPVHGRTNSDGDKPGRERWPQKRAAVPRITGNRNSGKIMWAWLTWVGQLKKTALGSPFCRVCSQLSRLLKSGCWHTSITACYSFEGKRDVRFLHTDKLTSSNQTNRLSPSLNQQDTVKTKGSWLGRGKILNIFSWHSLSHNT